MSKQEPKLFANVQWVEGEDKNKYSVGLSTDWIVGFNFQEWKSENRDPSLTYVIEWRQPGKKPPRGWTCYDGLVMDVSSSVALLEKKFLLYGAQRSPRNPALNSFETKSTSRFNTTVDKHAKPGSSKEQDAPSEPIEPKVKRPKRIIEVTPRRRPENDTEHSDDDDKRSEDETSGGSTPRNNGEETLSNDGNDPPGALRDNLQDVNVVGDGIDAAGGLQNGNNGNHENQNGGGRNARNDDAVIGAPGDLDRNQQAHNNEVLQRVERLLMNFDQRERPAIEPQDPDTVEIGVRGSGIRISKDKWDTANEQGTFTSMALSLVTSLFHPDVLLHSNVKGGKSKIHKGEDNAPRHDPLDGGILQAITVSVRNRFPAKFNRAIMHAAINGKLSAMRSAAKKAARNVQ